MWPVFKIKMSIYQSKANFDEKVLFEKITHHLDPEMRKMLVRPDSILVYDLLTI